MNANASKRIVFLGDSITDDGTYISYLDAFFRQQPDARHPCTFINLGVSSETASGLSEPDHPFPRPCIHERLERALSESRPDWTVICYGMNDGIYYPFSEERFAAYRDGMNRLIEAVRATGSKVIVMTPPPFDAASLSGAILLPEGEEKYSYLTPFIRYDDVLERYAEWVLGLESAVDAVIAIREPLLQYIAAQKNSNTDYRYGDGIHPDAGGHWVIAQTLLRQLFQQNVEQGPDTWPIYPLVYERHRLLSAAWKEHVGHTNENKAEALPLDKAIQHGELLEGQIQELLQAYRNG
ncbi:SGNH/GDSL hydrolase family protein [Paenibacillus sp. NPDC058174]|uniref:SGNH/GDSL hydrolase family protein n=1 Tax=Paenibacillus sp. NPDC058174 TaxID=3346366 RepID=UPI0036DB0711